MIRQRLDSLLVARGLAETKSKAQALVMAGEVYVNGQVVTKPGKLFSQDVSLQMVEKLPYVSRGGIKLAFALDEFGIDVRSLVVMDVGAGTGGFTDCLLQRGAKRVYAIDVGFGQLDYKLRNDHRVVVMEKVNARYPFLLPEKVDMATVDLSFISVVKVIPNILKHLVPAGFLLILFKPQFEAKREEVGKKGIIKDPIVHARSLGRFLCWTVNQSLRLRGLISSPILGAEGNREFLVLLTVEGRNE